MIDNQFSYSRYLTPAMNSLTSDVSRLSIGESSIPLESTQTDTPTPDRANQAFDKKILSVLPLNVEGHPAFLLSIIVNNDEKLINLSIDDAERMIAREASLTQMLQKGCKDCSFNELRRSSMFCFYLPLMIH